MKKPLPFVWLFIAIIPFMGCDKLLKDEDGITCENMRHLRITSNSPVKIGQRVELSAPEVGGNRIYRWIGPNHFEGSSPSASFSSAELKNEGWYYLNVSNNSCAARIDSVYIDVQLEQGTPGCTKAANTTGYSNLANDAYSDARKGIERTFSLFSLEGTGGGNITVYFHPKWRTKEPEDGIYTTINTPLFDQVDANYNKVFVTTTKQSIYWSSWEGQQVYVSHVAGKLQVQFCDLNMGGYNGTSFNTKASGNILER